MTDATFNTIEQYVSDYALVLKPFTDRVDADLLESLGEYGFIRNPETNEVIYTQMNYNEAEGTETVEIKRTTVTTTDVIDALEDLAAYDTFFDFIGSDKETELNPLKTALASETELPNLASIIQSLQSHHGEFWQSSN